MPLEELAINIHVEKSPSTCKEEGKIPPPNNDKSTSSQVKTHYLYEMLMLICRMYIGMIGFQDVNFEYQTLKY